MSRTSQHVCMYVTYFCQQCNAMCNDHCILYCECMCITQCVLHFVLWMYVYYTMRIVYCTMSIAFCIVNGPRYAGPVMEHSGSQWRYRYSGRTVAKTLCSPLLYLLSRIFDIFSIELYCLCLGFLIFFIHLYCICLGFFNISLLSFTVFALDIFIYFYWALLYLLMIFLMHKHLQHQPLPLSYL